MNKPGLKILFSLLISITLGTVIFLLIPLDPNPKIIKEIQTDYLRFDTVRLKMADINRDGIDEMVTGAKASNGMYTIQVINNTGGVIKQWNFKPELSSGIQQFQTVDYDNNGVAEIFLLYNIGDLLFMDILFYEDEALTRRYQNIFLDSLKTMPGFSHIYESSNISFSDLNNDGAGELIFSIFSKFETWYPRKLYAYDLKNDSLWASEPLNNILGSVVCFDHEGDGRIEISGKCGAPDNNKEGHEDYRLHDKSAWLMVFNPEMKLIDSLLQEFPGINTAINVFPHEIAGKTELAGFCTHALDGAEPDYLFYTKGLTEIIVTDTVPALNGSLGFLFFPLVTDPDSGFVGIKGSKHLVFIDQGLKIKSTRILPADATLFEPADLCDGPDPEIITKDYNSNIIRIYSREGRLLAEKDVGLTVPGITNSGITNFTGTKALFLASNSTIGYFKVEANKWYFLRWLILAGIIGILYLFSWLSMMLQKRQTMQKAALAERMRQLELTGINNQLDPHFTFNSLNVLKFLADAGDHKGVENFVRHFSKILRQQLSSSDKPAHKLSEELELVRHYVELQKLRYEIPINLDQTVASEVDMNLLIPKMLIHTHVENAIKHGLIPSPGGGTIFLDISAEKNQAVISIRDNGIGRGSRSENVGSHGRGLKILGQLIELFFRLYKVQINQEFIDLKDEAGNPAGTEVIIRINT